MTKYILKRVGISLVTVFVLVTVVFFLARLMPGGPEPYSVFAHGPLPWQRAFCLSGGKRRPAPHGEGRLS